MSTASGAPFVSRVSPTDVAGVDGLPTAAGSWPTIEIVNVQVLTLFKLHAELVGDCNTHTHTFSEAIHGASAPI